MFSLFIQIVNYIIIITHTHTHTQIETETEIKRGMYLYVGVLKCKLFFLWFLSKQTIFFSYFE